ncbi:MAG: histidine kinase [Betaproteobacteria bacterium]
MTPLAGSTADSPSPAAALGGGANPASADPLAKVRGRLQALARELTWKRVAVFAAVIGVMALGNKASLITLRDGHDILTTLARFAKTYASVFAQFAPVFVAVFFVESRPPASTRSRIVRLVWAVMLGVLAGCALHALVVRVLDPGLLALWHAESGSKSDPMVSVRRYAGYLFLSSLMAGLATAFYFFFKRDAQAAQALHQGRLEQDEIECEYAEAKLAVMQAQIEPHFIFNTLASVRRLYQTDHASGRTMLEHLSRYLTASLSRMREASSTLGRELALVTAYLNVQKIRMASRLDFRMDVAPALQSVAIPPMMLTTLVENAVIHGLGPLPDGGRIVISARTKGGKLLLEVADSGRGLEETWGVGVGLANISARLHSEFGGEASLELSENPGGGVVAAIAIPMMAPVEALPA